MSHITVALQTPRQLRAKCPGICFGLLSEKHKLHVLLTSMAPQKHVVQHSSNGVRAGPSSVGPLAEEISVQQFFSSEPIIRQIGRAHV